MELRGPNHDYRPRIEVKWSMWTHTFGCELAACSWLSGMNGNPYREMHSRKCYTQLRPFQGFPSVTPLNTHPLSQLCEHCYLNLLFPAIRPALRERQALFKKRKGNLGLWNLSQSREEALCNPLSSLCVCSRPKCFLQKRCDRESGFLWWSFCFWAVMKRGKAQAHTV